MIRKLIAILVAIPLLCLLNINNTSAQCTPNAYTEPGVGTLTPNCSWAGATAGPGTYTRFNVVNGGVYTWETCGYASWDTRLILTNSSNSIITGNDDACSLQSRITWTSNFTGQARIHLYRYNCRRYGTAGSATIRYRVTDSSSHTWTGVINDRWTNRRNWLPPCLPTSSDNVTIPNTSRKPRLINSENGYANTVTMSSSSGARLNLQNSSRLTVTQ